jgi:antitoxin ParD1/3/4
MPSSYVIGEHFEAFIKKQVSQGRYASASEVVRALKLQALRDDIQRGADSGPGIPAKKAFADVRKRIAATGTRRAAGG